MEQYLEEKKASQKRPAATFQRQDKKMVVYQTPQRPAVIGSSQLPFVRSPGAKKECPHCGKVHGGTECWMITGKFLKCGSSDHKIRDCLRLQQGVQRGVPAPAACGGRRVVATVLRGYGSCGEGRPGGGGAGWTRRLWVAYDVGGGGCEKKWSGGRLQGGRREGQRVVAYGCGVRLVRRGKQEEEAQVPGALAYAIKRSCENKAKVVSLDEKESGLRATLNLGHTFGHAYRDRFWIWTMAAWRSSWLHAGTVMAVDMSYRLGWVDDVLVKRVHNLLQQTKLPTAPPLRSDDSGKIQGLHDCRQESGRWFATAYPSQGSS
ncbi:hypothetical protein Taro_027827 [Colocasia esculenta]|uniref:3-dehydroquinate synthase C-terminal domain-containing protein n=1 Tax=Colocasia esculenta TaxID=4460 RepID=A0A843V9Q0_COLES|nr:hypothetical protein [Colocasia esculenta]